MRSLNIADSPTLELGEKFMLIYRQDLSPARRTGLFGLEHEYPLRLIRRLQLLYFLVGELNFKTGYNVAVIRN